MKKMVLLVALGLASVAHAQPPVAIATEGFYDFEDARTIFSVLGDEAKLSIDTTLNSAKSGRAALRFDYVIAPNKMNALLKTGQAGEAANIKSFRFWAKSDYATNLVMIMQEQDSGRWVSVFHVPKNQWQRVELSLDDFELSTNPDDPKDNNGKLDMSLVTAAALGDFKQIFVTTRTVVHAQTQVVGPNKTETAIEVKEEPSPVEKLLGVVKGPHTIWIDDFEATKQALPQPEPDTFDSVAVDNFIHPQLNWMMLGDALIKRVTEDQMKQEGRPVSVIGQGLQSEYRQQAGGLVGWAKMFGPGTLKEMVALRFAVATEQSMTLLVQLEEISGGKYNTTIELPADIKPAEVRLVPMLFEVAQDSKDNNKKLDLDQVKQILFIDATGLLGGAVADNAFWLSKLRIEKKPQ